MFTIGVNNVWSNIKKIIIKEKIQNFNCYNISINGSINCNIKAGEYAFKRYVPLGPISRFMSESERFPTLSKIRSYSCPIWVKSSLV